MDFAVLSPVDNSPASHWSSEADHRVSSHQRAAHIPTADRSIPRTPPISATTLFGNYRSWANAGIAHVARTGCSAGDWRFRLDEMSSRQTKWFFTGQTARYALIEMLGNRDLVPTAPGTLNYIPNDNRDSPTVFFRIDAPGILHVIMLSRLASVRSKRQSKSMVQRGSEMNKTLSRIRSCEAQPGRVVGPERRVIGHSKQADSDIEAPSPSFTNCHFASRRETSARRQLLES
ncbi:hypothetical protein ACVWZ4_001293 [Bradyrhizobium sp. USDA 4472]